MAVGGKMECNLSAAGLLRQAAFGQERSLRLVVQILVSLDVFATTPPDQNP
jgi:hypothetical protein